jgi:hypothetical protein
MYVDNIVFLAKGRGRILFKLKKEDNETIWRRSG